MKFRVLNGGQKVAIVKEQEERGNSERCVRYVESEKRRRGMQKVKNG